MVLWHCCSGDNKHRDEVPCIGIGLHRGSQDKTGSHTTINSGVLQQYLQLRVTHTQTYLCSLHCMLLLEATSSTACIAKTKRPANTSPFLQHLIPVSFSLVSGFLTI